MIEPADVNPDLEQAARVATAAASWQGSPSGTVWRKPLFRKGGEFGPVTSLVRYDAGGNFPPHSHPQGEEIFVLSGVFADEQGTYPPGTFLFNPDSSKHAPRSALGCDLLVRLRQAPGVGRRRRVVDTNALVERQGVCVGSQVREVWSEAGYPQSVWLVRLPPGFTASAPVDADDLEVLVLRGRFYDEAGGYDCGTWIRWPAGTRHRPGSTDGALLLLRYGCERQSGQRRLGEAAGGCLPYPAQQAAMRASLPR